MLHKLTYIYVHGSTIIDAKMQRKQKQVQPITSFFVKRSRPGKEMVISGVLFGAYLHTTVSAAGSEQLHTPELSCCHPYNIMRMGEEFQPIERLTVPQHLLTG